MCFPHIYHFSPISMAEAGTNQPSQQRSTPWTSLCAPSAKVGLAAEGYHGLPGNFLLPHNMGFDITSNQWEIFRILKWR